MNLRKAAGYLIYAIVISIVIVIMAVAGSVGGHYTFTEALFGILKFIVFVLAIIMLIISMAVAIMYADDLINSRSPLNRKYRKGKSK